MPFEKAVLYAARNYGVARVDLEEAVRSGDLTAGVLPGGGWGPIHPEDLEAWLESQ